MKERTGKELQHYMRLDCAAAALGISRGTLNRWLREPGIWTGYLKPILRLSYKTVLLPRKGVEELARVRAGLNGGAR